MSPLIQTAPDAPPLPGGKIVNSIVGAITDRKVVRIAQSRAEHPDDSGQSAIEGGEQADAQQVQPSIQTTKTHIALLIPKNWAWAFLCAAAIGGPSLLQYAASRAGLVTQAELQSSIRTAVEDAVKTAIDPIDKRLRAIERKNAQPQPRENP